MGRATRCAVWVGIACGLLAPAAAWACSYACGPWVGASLGGPDVQRVPSNLAVQSSSQLTFEDGTAIDKLVFDTRLDLARPVVALPVGTRLLRGGEPVEVTSGEDVTPPDAPALRGGSIDERGDEGTFCHPSNCGPVDVATVDIQAPADDSTAPEHLTYVFYVGTTPEGARASNEPLALSVANDHGEVTAHAACISPTYQGEELWVSLTVLDLAGNESPHSPAIALRKGDEGCLVANHQPAAWALWPLAALLWVARRRAGRLQRR